MNQIRAVKRVVSRIQYLLSKQQKRSCIVIIIMIIVGSFLETLGVSAILPFIDAILSPETLTQKWYIKPFIQFLHLDNTNTVIIMIGIGIIIVYFAKNVYLYLSTIAQNVVRSKIKKDLSTKMLRSYIERSYEDFLDINTSEVIRGIGVDIDGVYDLIDNLFRFLGELFTALLISAFIIYTDVFMALCIIIIAGICFLFITLGLKKKTKHLGEQKKVANTIRGNCAYQTIMGFKEIKVTQTTDYFVETYNNAYEKQRVAEVNNEKITNLPERIIESMCVATLISVICVKIQIGADMTEFVPKLAVFAVAAFRLLPSVSRMTRYMNGVIFNNTFLISVYENMQEIDNYKKEERKEIQQNNSEEWKKFENQLNVDNIEWKYRGTKKSILKNLSVEIKRGEAVALIGKSGAGKTTLADIILGLIRPQKGDVTMDGQSIFRYTKEWSKTIGYVPQNVYLLDDTIRNNVAFGHGEKNIDDEQIWKALEQAQLKEFVESLPEQLDTQVGERGIKFSGGQRQRVAIARTLYSNPDIIVLDEATSALDNDTEKAVMEAIDSLQGQKTLIIVAHRLTTIKNCNRIYEIVNGNAVLRERKEIMEEIERA